MKAIIFGGTGFLGSHVADMLTNDGFEVTIYDLKPSPYLKNNQKMVIGDILDFEKIQKVTKGSDIVYNFAGIADIEEAAADPVQAIHTNVLGNTRILEACRLNAVKRYLFASTLYVYSNLGSFYRASKQSCELIIEAYAERFGLNYTILRYGSLYGPRANSSNWIHGVLKQALTEKKITRYGDGQELREYIHVLDAARLSVKVLSDYENQYVIITGQQSIKIEDLMTMIKEMFNNKIELEFQPGSNSSHYEITPYTFKPNLAVRILDSHYVDLGQGLLDILHDLQKQEHKEEIKMAK